jgi:hypothetical protein
MKTLKYSLAIAALMSACLTSQAISLLDGPIVNPANNHVYYLSTPGTWTNVEVFAQSIGGHLATINDAAENTWVYNNVNVFDPVNNVERNGWLGMYNLDFPAGSWSWASGEAATYFNWSPGEPNFPEEKFVHYGGPAPGWNNLYWDVNLVGIIEVVPEPSTLSLGLVAALGCAIARRRRAHQPG